LSQIARRSESPLRPELEKGRVRVFHKALDEQKPGSQYLGGRLRRRIADVHPNHFRWRAPHHAALIEIRILGHEDVAGIRGLAPEVFVGMIKETDIPHMPALRIEIR
jgi:hypothetical protein